MMMRPKNKEEIDVTITGPADDIKTRLKKKLEVFGATEVSAERGRQGICPDKKLRVFGDSSRAPVRTQLV